MRIAVGVLAMTLLAVTACESSESASPVTVTVTSSVAQPSVTKRSGTQEYQSAQELADDLVRLGYTCDLRPLTGTTYALDSGQCNIGGQDMIISIFASQSQIDAQVQSANRIMESLGQDYGWLTGRNLGINCTGEDWCKYIAAGLGGNITAPSTPGARMGTLTPPPPPTFPR